MAQRIVRLCYPYRLARRLQRPLTRRVHTQRLGPTLCGNTPLRQLTTSTTLLPVRSAASPSLTVSSISLSNSKEETVESLIAISTSHLGTHYEQQVKLTLESVGMHLARVGGANDKGVDLRGTWQLHTQTNPFKVIVQCKAEQKPVGPSRVRELLGTLTAESPGTVGVLVALNGFSPRAYDAANRGQPICLVGIGLHGGCHSFWMGPRASKSLGDIVVVKGLNGAIHVSIR
ncbi:hypothetical protein BASA50_001343 [Batrachochytrium salamandrivorans]|uniref:Restriction endonuclease type IV Mrr domain-containing protein n=1 Tax=Batrachochytrium salamandrivorans TaxID=1357716 RepID=A0ABQ8EVH0_9FUNG|nr:hypothetical protein BASA60_004058 [Batrachochytrium salamandrivorans]KAH6587210.1 hypothetical protein BASA50_001343 [Batrachochytrium salamandrivorans]KAJ1345358.1 hypothetical protein BSLG_000871 [Batrachochytrium salamandrivorans]